MKKINWKIIIITCIVSLLPMVIGIILYNKLPEQMPVHFGMDNKPDNYASKNFALFAIPVLLTLVQLFCCIITDINEKSKQEKPKMVTIVKWFIPLMSIVLYFIMIQTALGNLIDARKYIMLLLGILFILIGNYAPKMSFQNAQVFMHPAPKNEKKYRRMSRLLGYTFVIFGIGTLISVFFEPIISAIAIISLLVVILIEGVYCLIKK